jgi:15-cis-phytoene synthase/lycopene beta-cyclase
MLTYTQVLFLLVVPPALVLAFLTRPIVGKMEVYKLLALVVIAFVYSTPWYLHLFISRSEFTRF